jgi:guanylate kinase
VLPPSPQVLQTRLRNRSQAEGMTVESVIERRLAEAQEELKQIWKYKYALVNDVLDQAATELRAIVLAERDGQRMDARVRTLADGCRTDHPSARLEAALGTFAGV